MDNKIIICSCNSLEHQMMLWHDKEDNEIILYTEIHLITYHNFFKRLWYGIRYVFGYKSRFGAWDEFIFDDENYRKLKEFINSR
jgi:hypothetical protein